MRALRKRRREEMRCLYIVRNETRCRSESMESVDCNEVVGLMFTLWLWVNGSEIFRLSRDSVFYASGIKLQ